MSKAIELAAWMNEGAWHQITLGQVWEIGAELRRLSAIEAELAAIKESIGASVGGYWWNAQTLQTRMIEKDHVWTASDQWVFIGHLYAIKDKP